MSTLDEKTIQTLNIYQICRICLLKRDDMKSIFSPIETEMQLESNVYNFLDVLCKVADVQPNNEELPSLLCENCIALLSNAYKFKIQYEASCKYLEKYLLINKAELKYENFEQTYCDNKQDLKGAKERYNVIGRRMTSKKQIEKRFAHSSVTSTKSMKRRGRKPNMKKRQRKYEEENEESDEQNVEEKPVLHPCPICTKEFPALELREHAHTHKALKKYLSIPEHHKVTPNVRFYYKHDPNKIKVTLHNMIIKIHKCVMCEEEYTADDLRIHLETHRNQKEFKCDQCERVFKQLNHLNTHKVKHLKEFPYKCENCGKGFVIKTNYDCHILTHNTNQELPHECSHCFKRFSNPEHLNRHIIIHTENVSYSVKYRVCKCHHCLKTFKDRSELKSHKCVPIEQAVNTIFPCKICNKVFKNSSGLYNHNRNIHKLKGAKVLCSVCGNYVSNIYNHMMRHTGEKPFECNQCGKRFVGKPQLRQHLLVHSGLKPYVCSVCAKAFNNLYNLQVHERIHKGDRCHICPLCKKGFLEKSYLKKHMNIHTRL